MIVKSIINNSLLNTFSLRNLCSYRPVDTDMREEDIHAKRNEKLTFEERSIMTSASVHKLENPKYIQPISFDGTYNGEKRTFELCIPRFEASAVLMYNETQKKLVFVRQFRAGIYLSHYTKYYKDLLQCCGKVSNQCPPPIDSFVYELTAGVIDPGETPIQAAVREMEEETGYRISHDRLIKIATTTAINGQKLHVYFGNVTDDDRVSNGGGCPNEGEDIEICYLPSDSIDDLKPYMEKMTSESLASIYWFMYNYKTTLKN